MKDLEIKILEKLNEGQLRQAKDIDLDEDALIKVMIDLEKKGIIYGTIFVKDKEGRIVVANTNRAHLTAKGKSIIEE